MHESNMKVLKEMNINQIMSKLNQKVLTLESTLSQNALLPKSNLSMLDETVTTSVLESTSAFDELSSTLKDGQLFMFKLERFQQKRERNERFTSPSFYTSPGGYSVVVCVDANGSSAGHVTVTAPILLRGKYDAKLKWPLTGKLTVTLLNQRKDNKHHHKISTLSVGDDARVGSSFNFQQFIPHVKLAHNTTRNPQFLKDDTVECQWTYLTPQALAAVCNTTTCTCTDTFFSDLHAHN